MTVFVMKLLAVCSMLIDHTAVFLYPHFIGKPVYEWMRAFGRLGFPIFAFLIVNGYQKTHDVKRYLTRLIAFAAISQIPFTLALQVISQDSSPSPQYLRSPLPLRCKSTATPTGSQPSRSGSAGSCAPSLSLWSAPRGSAPCAWTGR